MPTIELWCGDARARIAAHQATGRRFRCIHVDWPWIYSGGKTGHGTAAAHYDGIDDTAIPEWMADLYEIAEENAYCFFWITFPKLNAISAYLLDPASRWRYVTGAAWIKTQGALGLGYHVRGRVELCLIFTKGSILPAHGAPENLWWEAEVVWTEDRTEIHSEKPAPALADLVLMAGGDVFDPFAGASASLMRVVQLLNATGGAFAYDGCEIDPARYQTALDRARQLPPPALERRPHQSRLFAP